MARTNREILTGGSKYRQKQAKKYGVEEVVFNKDERQEYLTGFHKRKVERQKKAKSFYEEQERLAKIEERKKAREERQKEFEDKIKELDTVKELRLGKSHLDGDNEEDQHSDANEEKTSWNGFDSASEDGEDNKREGKEEEEEEETEEPLKGILHTKHVYKIDDPRVLGDAVVDEETTVSVDSVENPYMVKAGVSLVEIAKANHVNLQKSEEVLEKSIDRAKKYAVICGVDKSKPKQKKKKFRYLTKGERRENNRKAKLSKMKSRNRD
ncbi:hypothetical protein PUMCH_002156 [Australozyma saopauloensis]|uniref:Ribosomal RNA-processing protein 17 n=1 Tax=Australozyma saopauloensis TaxID=291208 RepID=A0AAX4H9C6_9ASCO|nr:hypothetical protein PUMCH_002156 [[Candida] saopauloensis]